MNPKARKNDLVIQDLNGELFIYDTESDKVYSLNATSAFVWNNLDGTTSTEALSDKAHQVFGQSISEDFIWLAIDELRKNDLLEAETAPKAMSKLKRREAIKQIGLASMVALPVISMLIAPTALNAQSSSLRAVCQPCTTSSQCAPPATCKPIGICGVNEYNTTRNLGFDFMLGPLNTCNAYATAYCCSGMATFTAPTTCICS